ncbi:hypothetical protein D9758_008766 [Tetrapyrgos nigripes]|uniref:Uncharacterized protein n=1 Tax=Tetrapyrgos nigripes TaxID=182062 RepID=A0A8H5FXR1_9AGAR|nr:hypothetical protein D9758_008766 [Tetrapyrgos nigripes]
MPQPRFKKEYDKSKPTLSQKLDKGKRLTPEESASLQSLMVELALKKLPRDSEGNAIQVPRPDPLAFDEDPTQFGPEVTPGVQDHHLCFAASCHCLLTWFS